MSDWVLAFFSWLASALPSLSPLVVPVVGGSIAAAGLVLAAIAGTRAAAQINAEAQKAIAKANADSAQQIATINTKSAQTAEQIKADGLRRLEREKFNREWRRERVKPLLKNLKN